MDGICNTILDCVYFYEEVVMVLVTPRELNNLNFSLTFSNKYEYGLLLLRFATTLLEQDFYERTSR